MKARDPIGASLSTQPPDATDPYSDTIVAAATPPGRGAIKVIRVSGPSSRRLVHRRLPSSRRRLWKPRLSSLTDFLDRHGNRIDRVLLTFFAAPASYTGEDVVEISCHGSPAVEAQIVDGLLEAGARLAEPGEFTLRAFLNGKMDLVQAEAVRDLIRSQTAHQARIARDQLDGKLSRVLRSVKGRLVRVISHLETGLEFVEDPVEPDSRDSLLRNLRRIAGRIRDLEESFRVGRVLRDGFTATVVGRPNAGKSSIFNALCRTERAIVSPVAGTTRDAVDQAVDLEGIPMQLVDTAGIRRARNPVERLGVRKSLDYVGASDLTLFVVDRSRDFSAEDARIWKELKDRPYLLVVNKVDLEAVLRIPSELESGARSRSDVSALTGQGVDALRRTIREAVAPDSDWERERVVITDLRHKECLHRARQRLGEGMKGYRDGLSEEFPLYHLRGALSELDAVTGETTVEDLLGQIFSTFCIGK